MESARQPLRKELARTFRAEHTREIAEVRAELPGEIHKVEKRYGIRFSVPRL